MEYMIPTLENSSIIRNYLSNNIYRACELAVANNVMWSSYYGTRFMLVEGMLVYCVLKEGRLIRVSYPMGDGDEKAAFDKMLAMFDEAGTSFSMYLVSEKKFEKIEDWYPGEFQIEYDRDSADYLYLRESLATLKGGKLHGKRNHINRFLAEHPDYEYERIDRGNIDECLRFEDVWLRDNSDGEDSSKEYERGAIEFALKNMEELRLIGALIRVDGEICAFTVGEQLTEDTFVIHFEKAKSGMQGAYPIINREFVRHELTAYTYINREEDMGIPGLRYAKSTYQPIELVKKGIVSRI